MNKFLFYKCLKFLIWLFNAREVLVVSETTIAEVYAQPVAWGRAFGPGPMKLSRGDVFIYVGSAWGTRRAHLPDVVIFPPKPDPRLGTPEREFPHIGLKDSLASHVLAECDPRKRAGMIEEIKALRAASYGEKNEGT